MPILETDSIILQAFAYSESSKILRLATPAHGIIPAIAKGAMRPKSPYGGVLEPFTRGTATIHLKGGRDLQTLSGFDLVRSGHALCRDLTRFAAASVLAELVLRTTVESAESGTFDLLDAALRELEAAETGGVDRVALAHAWKLVGHLGYAPVLDACVACGRALGGEEDGFFDYDGGGARCMACGRPPFGRPLPSTARNDLRRLCAGEVVPLTRSAAHWDLFATFLGCHLLEQGSLRSFGVLAGLLDS
ncbi:MAG TPA: DNA repair protein RecO [Longimicrobiales bacterium]|nr:DNA repair protein RecO [Longimicrobiales bacterium]